MDIVKSKDNKKIKYVKALSTKKHRDEENAFIIEGVKYINEAIKEKVHIIYLIFLENALKKQDVKNLYDSAISLSLNIIVCEASVFNYLADTINSQGVIAVINKKESIHTLDDYNFVIFCDRIQDPGNLGTIIRTADAFGPACVVLNKGCVDPYNPKVVRATAGAIFRVPIISIDENEEIINKLENTDFKIISTVVNSNKSFNNIASMKKICLVIGNEGQGVSQEIVNKSHEIITIKMTGNAESLNASIAAGISIYEIRKKLL